MSKNASLPLVGAALTALALTLPAAAGGGHHAQKGNAPAATPPAPALSAPMAPDTTASVVTSVRIERVKPTKEKYPTLQFLKANRDFIRSRYDLLRARALPGEGNAGAIDPRFLAYRRMITEASASQDSLEQARDRSRRWELFANITDLGQIEDQLDLMDRQLAGQKARLAELQRDFTGRQMTSLAVVLSGVPAGDLPATITLMFESGDTLTVPLPGPTAESLRQGGVLELCHRLIEPREQTLTILLQGGRWNAGAPGYVTLDPPRDQLSFLRLDLAPARPEGGASSMTASRWLNDTGLEASRGPESQP